MAEIRLTHVGKKYALSNSGLFAPKRSLRAVDDFSLTVQDGEFLVIVGPSGCGKSTVLRMIAGLEEITSGRITIRGKEMQGVDPKDRNVAMVFQSFALFPHMTVYDNIAYGLKSRKYPADEIREKVSRISEILGLTQLLDRYPKSLSGGEKQRVALGRALVRDPDVLLMDEPLSSLDAQLKEDLRAELAQLHREYPVTTVYVTHDQIEAMALADRMVVMKEGRIQQIGTPQEIFAEPENLFVAGFVGTPRINEIRDCFVTNGGNVLLNDRTLGPISKADHLSTVTVGVRPQDVLLGDGGFEGTVNYLEKLGNEIYVHLEAQGSRLVSCMPAADIPYPIETGQTVRFDFRPGAILFFDGETGERVTPENGTGGTP